MTSHPLKNSVNIPQKCVNDFLLSSKSKRPSPPANDSPNKRVKLASEPCPNDENTDESSSEDEYMDLDPPVAAPIRRMRRDPFRLHSWNAPPNPSTTWLQSFVSSKSTDVFRCHHRPSGVSLVPPYSCAYNNAGKNSGKSILATGMEDGSLLLFDTRRRDSDETVHPPPTHHLLHRSSIFGLEWHPSDASIAIGRGNQTAGVVNVETGTMEYQTGAHKGTIRCVAWDAESPYILTTGSRDGHIFRWDLRSNPKKSIHHPIQKILDAHASNNIRKQSKSLPTSVTKILHPQALPYGLISSGSADGILKCWDLRNIPSNKVQLTNTCYISETDPTASGRSRRPRGIISLCEGRGPSSGVLFALARNGEAYTYAASNVSPLTKVYSHPQLHSDSWYISAATSPCGRWMACSGIGKAGNAFVFDIRGVAHSRGYQPPGVHLRTSLEGQLGMLDWDQEGLATTADSGIIRKWRLDQDLRSKCCEDPETMSWKYLWVE